MQPDPEPDQVILTRDQGLRLVSLQVALNEGAVALTGDLQADAESTIRDVAEECALQLRGGAGV